MTFQNVATDSYNLHLVFQCCSCIRIVSTLLIKYSDASFNTVSPDFSFFLAYDHLSGICIIKILCSRSFFRRRLCNLCCCRNLWQITCIKSFLAKTCIICCFKSFIPIVITDFHIRFFCEGKHKYLIIVNLYATKPIEVPLRQHVIDTSVGTFYLIFICIIGAATIHTVSTKFQ